MRKSLVLGGRTDAKLCVNGNYLLPAPHLLACEVSLVANLRSHTALS